MSNDQPMRRVLAGLALGLSVACVAGCDGALDAVYTAQRYDAEGECIEGSSALGLVTADELAATCEPLCLEFDGELYVSAICPPYPGEASVVEPTESDCAAALALFALADGAGLCEAEE